MRLHFDGYSECHDFWLNADSPDIHPPGWFEETGHKLQPPKGKQLASLSWWVMLKEGDVVGPQTWNWRWGQGGSMGPRNRCWCARGIPQDNLFGTHHAKDLCLLLFWGKALSPWMSQCQAGVSGCAP